MNRTALIVSGSIIAIALLGAAAFLFYLTGGSGSSQKASVTPLFPNASSTAATMTGTSGTAEQQQESASSSPGSFPTSAATASSSAAVPQLFKITSGPVVPGVVVFDTAASSTNPGAQHAVVRYVDKQSGNLYSYDTQAAVLSRTANKTIPGILDAHWLSDGSRVYLHYLASIGGGESMETYALSDDGSNGFSLPQNITQLITQGTTAVTALVSGSGGSIATRANPDYTKTTAAFTTPLSKIVFYAAGKNYVVATKPSSTEEGYAFLVNQKTGAFERVAGPKKGLMVLPSPDGAEALVSYVDSSGTLQSELLNLSTRQATVLPIATIVANKCVWSADSSTAYCGIPRSMPTANYPDSWYQGLVSFSDTLWKLDVANHYATRLTDFSQNGGHAFDMTSLAIDPNQGTLTFVNKKDGSLWGLRLTP